MNKNTKSLPAAVLSAFLLALAPGLAQADTADLWPSLKTEIFGDKAIAEASPLVSIEAPIRAEDAAIVPIAMTISKEVGAKARKLTLIIDHNPAPVAATFTFGPAAGDGERRIETRVRVDSYTDIRAVLETDDGALHMVSRFLKASGGCSAPAGKDALAALEGLGRMQIKTSVGEPANGVNQAQVMIKHPNFTGLQMDQITRAFTPARFVQTMDVKSGGELVFRMEGGISISENPHFRFSYPAGKSGVIEVTAKDTEGAEFQGKSEATSGT